jgi:hypothetical protein
MCLANDSFRPCNLGTVHLGAAAARFTDRVAEAVLFAEFGSVSPAGSATAAVFVYVPAAVGLTMIATVVLCPDANPLIMHVTVWPLVVQGPDPVAANSIVSPAGTLSVNVIGAEPGPPLDTVEENTAELPTVVVLGAADFVTPASSRVIRVAATFIEMPGGLGPGPPGASV